MRSPQIEDLPSVILPNQIHHARELLGHSLPFILTFRSGESTSHFVYDTLRNHLPAKWQNRAQAIATTLINESNRYQMDPLFVLAVIQLESQFNPLTRGSHGERGLMQMRPSTARWLERELGLRHSDLFDPIGNIRAGVAYMAWLRQHFHFVSSKYVSAYNIGPSRVLEMGTEPSSYMRRVMQRYLKFHGALVSRKVSNL